MVASRVRGSAYTPPPSTLAGRAGSIPPPPTLHQCNGRNRRNGRVRAYVVEVEGLQVKSALQMWGHQGTRSTPKSSTSFSVLSGHFVSFSMVCQGCMSCIGSCALFERNHE